MAAARDVRSVRSPINLSKTPVESRAAAPRSPTRTTVLAGSRPFAGGDRRVARRKSFCDARARFWRAGASIEPAACARRPEVFDDRHRDGRGAGRTRAPVRERAAHVGLPARGISTEWNTRFPLEFALPDEAPADRFSACSFADPLWARGGVAAQVAMDDIYAGAPRPRPSRLRQSCGVGQDGAIITQNIDGLHQPPARLSDAVIELARQRHIRQMPVLRYALRIPPTCASKFDRTGFAPESRSGGGAIKSATISFWQAWMPEDQMRRAQEEPNCAISSWRSGRRWSSIRPPAFRALVKRRGAVLAIVNGEET